MIFENVDALIAHMISAGAEPKEVERIRAGVAKRRTLLTWDAPWLDLIFCADDVANNRVPGYIAHGFSVAAGAQRVSILKMDPYEARKHRECMAAGRS